MLKNVSNEVQVISYDGRQYPVEPNKAFEVRSMAPIGKISDHEAFCLEEKWSKETGYKLSQIGPKDVQEAPKKEEPKPILKEDPKAPPAKPEPIKPVVKKDESGKKRGKK